MKRLDASTVEYESDAEVVIVEIHTILLDRGFSAGDALIFLRGADITKSGDTAVLDRILTADLVDWLVS